MDLLFGGVKYFYVPGLQYWRPALPLGYDGLVEVLRGYPLDAP